jgi:ERCC4-type nuclease
MRRIGFAVTYNRKRRSLRTVTSELLSIPGIGPSKRRLLLHTFGSIQGVRDAPVDAMRRFRILGRECAATPRCARAPGRGSIDRPTERGCGTRCG